MKKAKHNKKVLLLVTDGFDTKSHINSTQVEDVLKRAQILVYAIGIDDDDDDPLVLRRTRYHIYHYMLGRLTSISGGRAFRLFTGRNYALNSLAQVLLEQLHQQYTLSYYPASGFGRRVDFDVGASRRTACCTFRTPEHSRRSRGRAPEDHGMARRGRYGSDAVFAAGCSARRCGGRRADRGGHGISRRHTRNDSRMPRTHRDICPHHG